MSKIGKNNYTHKHTHMQYVAVKNHQGDDPWFTGKI